MSPSRLATVLLSPLVACALLAGGAPRASAQCLAPDNLDIGPCCAPVLANLPAFPGVSLPGVGLCWTQCTLANKNPLKVSWAAPVPGICSHFTTILTVADGTSGLPLMTGPLTLDYTRTWDEVDTSGTVTQVWRFAAKADLSILPGAPLGTCPAPNCIAPVGPHPSAFFYGYVDYSGCVAAGPFDSVIMLYHASDRFIHMGGLSSTPGVFHPTQSFAIVAPDSSLQPFIPTNQIATTGPVIAEASRAGNLPGTILCVVEDKTLNGALTKLGAGCLSTMSQNPKQQTARDFKGTTACVNTAGLNGGWASLAISFPFLPWLHLVGTSIGTWSNPAIYPGKESCWAEEGLFVHTDACLGDFVELKYGASTRDGFTAILPSGVTVKNFTDIAANYSAPLSGPFPTPICGNVMFTARLIYVNLP